MDKQWFGRKKIGWGWGLPQTWQGWLTVALFFISIIIFRFISKTPLLFAILVLSACTLLCAIAWKTSGKPDWGIWLDNNRNKKITFVTLMLLLIFIVFFWVYQYFILQKAHNTFENYYAFRGCTQLIEKTADYGICKLVSGQTIKIVEIQNKWYLDGDGPGTW